MRKTCDTLRRLLGLALLLGFLAFLVYRWTHAGWEFPLSGNDIAQERPDVVQVLNLRRLAQPNLSFSPGALDALFLRHALRSQGEYALLENGVPLRVMRNRPEGKLFLDEPGRVQRVGRLIYFTPGDSGDSPRSEGSVYVLRLFPALGWFRLLPLVLSGIVLLLAPSSLPAAIRRHLAVPASQAQSVLQKLWLGARELPPRRVGLYCGLLSLLLAAAAWFCLIDSSWFFEPFGTIDSYLYVGYGYNYPAHDYLYGYYKISRLPWVFLQAALRRLIRPELATPLLAVFLTTAQGIIAYLLALRLTRHQAAALLTGAFALTSPLWHNICGWNYHAHPGALLLWLTLCLLPLTKDEATPWRYLAAFAVLTVGLHVNLLTLNLLPMLAIFCLIPLLDRPAAPGLAKNRIGALIEEFAPIAVYAGAAFTAATGALCLLHAFFYGEWLFFMPHVRTMFSLADHSVFGQDMSREWLEPGRLYISLLLVDVLASLLLLALKSGGSGENAEAGRKPVSPRLAALLFLIPALTFLAAHAKGTSVLSYDLHAYLLQSAGIMPLAAFLAWLLPGYEDFRRWFMFMPLFLTGLTLATRGGEAGKLLAEWCAYPLLPLSAVILALTALRRFIPKGNPARCAMLALLFALFAAYAHSPGLDRRNAPLNRILLRCYERLLRIGAAQKQSQGSIKDLRDLFCVAALDGDAPNEFPAVLFARSLGIMGFSALDGNGGAPKLEAFDPQKSPSKITNIVVIGGEAALDGRARDILLKLRLQPELVDASHEFDSGVSVFMRVYRVSQEENHASQGR